VNVRVEVRYRESWDQPVVIVHPDERHARELAEAIVDCLYQRFGRPARATIGDDPPESGRWAEGQVVYSRG
jgi:hypothetical protein